MKPVSVMATVLTVVAVLGMIVGYLGPYWPGVEDAGMNFGAAFLFVGSTVLVPIVAMIWFALLKQRSATAVARRGSLTPLGLTVAAFGILGVVGAVVSVALIAFAPPATDGQLAGLGVIIMAAAVELIIVGILLGVVLRATHQFRY